MAASQPDGWRGGVRPGPEVRPAQRAAASVFFALRAARRHGAAEPLRAPDHVRERRSELRRSKRRCASPVHGTEPVAGCSPVHGTKPVTGACPCLGQSSGARTSPVHGTEPVAGTLSPVHGTKPVTGTRPDFEHVNGAGSGNRTCSGAGLSAETVGGSREASVRRWGFGYVRGCVRPQGVLNAVERHRHRRQTHLAAQHGVGG